MRAVRIGIDVGGTHTKAVAIDNNTNEIIGKASVLTTHTAKRGVAKGVIECFEDCLSQNAIKPEEVIFIAHSTTQATNAMLEGDVAKVGIIGMGSGGLSGWLSKRQTNIERIELNNEKAVEVESTYIKLKDFNKDLIEKTIQDFIESGVEVIVATKAFGVDDATEEQIVADIAGKKNLLTTSASEITKLYGLATRTKTAALNASILPTMLETANSTEISVKETGIDVPLMIMRGDGGVMEISEMRRRPILTMLSGPAASVSGALMYLRASNAVFVEVGGTSTDISAIKDGKPTVDYSIIGGHRTYVNSLDVRVTGIAGGSMVRAKKGQSIIDVGPRSAHIANMDYACYTDPERIDGATLEFVRPTEGDPDDYVALKLKDGSYITITTSCAANALGLLTDEDFSKGNYESSVKAIAILAKDMGMSVEECADKILELATDKIIPVVESLIMDYELERDQISIIGGGGGAAALVKYVSKRMDIPYSIPVNAEVISSIGVALAMVREMVERTAPNPSIEDIASIKREAKELAMKSGAVEETIEVSVDIDDQAQKITAIAIGSTEVRSAEAENISLDDAKNIAAQSIRNFSGEMKVEYENGHVFCLSYEEGGHKQIRLVDSQGFIKVQRRHGGGELTTFGQIKDTIERLWEAYTNYSSEIRITPDLFIIDGVRLLDYSGLSDVDQATGLIEAELADHHDDDILYVLATRNGIY